MIRRGIQMAFVSALACAAIASPAGAHWQYSKWGMTPDQVVAASKGTVQRVDPSSDAALPIGVKEAAGTYSANDQSMRVSFWFKGGKLNQVHLAQDDADACMAVGRDLTGVYGQPTSRSGGMISTSVWLDKARGNRVQFSNWSTGGCDLIYAPLPTAQSTGL
ncbi:hypothetical protein [Sphingobium sp. TomTYG45]